MPARILAKVAVTPSSNVIARRMATPPRTPRRSRPDLSPPPARSFEDLVIDDESPPVQRYETDVLSRTVLSVADAVTAKEFVTKLNELRAERKLSYERLGRQCHRLGVRLSRSSAQKMLTRADLPQEQQMLAFLRVCGVTISERDMWRTELRRIRAEPGRPVIRQPATAPPAAPPKPVEPPAPEHQPDTPTEMPTPRRQPRPWLVRTSWLMAVKLMAVVIAVSLGTIVLWSVGLSVGYIVVIHVAVVGCVVIRTAVAVAPVERPHRNPYRCFAGDVFSCLELTTRSVIE